MKGVVEWKGGSLLRAIRATIQSRNTSCTFNAIDNKQLYVPPTTLTTRRFVSFIRTARLPGLFQPTMPARPLKPIPSNPVFPRAASSVLIVSPWLRTPTIDDPADYKVLMLRRSSRGFFGSLRVFPGGVLEDADKDPVWRTFIFPKFSNVTTSRLEEMEDAVLHDYEYLFRRGDPENRRVEGDARRDYGLGLMIAAVRETFEECGIALLYPRIDWLQGKKGSSEERVRISEAWRRKVHDDASQFATLCETFGVAPDLEKVVFWSNWNTPETEIRTYDAHFFLSVLDHPVGVGAGGSSSAGGGEPEQPGDDEVHPYVAADGTETLEFAWVTPQEGLDKFGSGDWEMVEPQFCSLAGGFFLAISMELLARCAC